MATGDIRIQMQLHEWQAVLEAIRAADVMTKGQFGGTWQSDVRLAFSTIETALRIKGMPTVHRSTRNSMALIDTLAE